MWGADSAVYGLKYGGRCIVAQANPPNMTGEQKDNATVNSDSDADSDSDLGLASKHYFLLGTTSLRESNEIHQVEYNEETGDLRCTAVYGHPDEVWHIAPNPNDSSLLCTTHTTMNTLKEDGSGSGSGSGNGNGNGRRVGTLWRFPTEAPPSDSPLKVMPLEKICSVPNSGTDTSASDTVDFQWETHSGTQGRCLSVARDGLRMMSLEGSALRVESTIGSELLPTTSNDTKFNTSFMTGFSKARWDPHHVNEIAASAGGDIFGYDLRQSSSSTPAHWIQGAHSQIVYDLDYNPNKPYCMMTCGDDCLIRFWDLRRATTCVKTITSSSSNSDTTTTNGIGYEPSNAQPIAVLRNHTHWVRTSKYNPFHDQLVLSAGSDAAVDLWRISSISSAPLLEMDGDDDDDDNNSDNSNSNSNSNNSNSDDDDNDNDNSSPKSTNRKRNSRNRHASETALDTLITRFDEAHEESVYSVAWSVAEAWTFASLSYDGRMVVNTVPSAEKYKILL